MLTLKQYINEHNNNPNLAIHLEHLEDQIFNGGILGIRDALTYLIALQNMLTTGQKVELNEARQLALQWKVDGAPAIICGKNPENGKFFVGTKGVFAKNPKLNYTNEDIDKHHPGDGVGPKLKIALKYLKELNIDGIYQCDMMFTSDMIKHETVQGTKCITFQPNTILYAVPVDSELAKEILRAKIGVIFHTQYNGDDIHNLSASFSINISHFRKTPNVWFRDPYVKDVTNKATLSGQENTRVSGLLSQAGRLFRQVDPRFANMIAQNDTYKNLLKEYNNANVRKGQPIDNTGKYVSGFFTFLHDKFVAKAGTYKRPESQQKVIGEKNLVMRFFRSNTHQLKLLYDIWKLLAEAKSIIISKLNGLVSIGTFFRNGDSFKVTNPEGFVAISLDNQKAVKLVDRLVFSRQNFNAAKEWKKSK